MFLTKNVHIEHIFHTIREKCGNIIICKKSVEQFSEVQNHSLTVVNSILRQITMTHFLNLNQKKSEWYCWCTTQYVWNLVNNGINYVSTGAGFLPWTVTSYSWEVPCFDCTRVTSKELGNDSTSTYSRDAGIFLVVSPIHGPYRPCMVYLYHIYT